MVKIMQAFRVAIVLINFFLLLLGCVIVRKEANLTLACYKSAHVICEMNE